MKSNRACLATIALLFALAGCRGFGPPSERTRGRIQAMPLAKQLPCEQFVVEIESPYLSGVFDAVCLVEPSALRLQLFPDVGGKVFDLSVLAASVTAVTPGSVYRAEAPLDRAEPHLALVLAGLLSELLAPVHGSRVLGERAIGGGQVEVKLRPALGSGEVVATLADDGRILSYQMGLGALHFSLQADGSFTGYGFAGRLCR